MSAKLPSVGNQGFVLANFERLIRGALASQDASSAQVRQVIYQSSRNALQKIIDNNRSLTVEAVMEQKRKLEQSIDEIEAEYNPPAPAAVVETPAEIEAQVFEEPAVVNNQPDEFIAPPSLEEPVAPQAVAPSPVQPVEQNPDPLHEIQQILESTTPKAPQPQAVQEPSLAPEPVATTQPEVQAVQSVAPAAPQPEPVTDAKPQIQQDEIDLQLQDSARGAQQQPPEAYYHEEENMPLGFSKRRKKQKRVLWTIIILLILGLLAWMAYIVFNNMVNGTLLGNNDNGPKLNPNSVSRQADSENYITVINANDLSSLNTAGSGKAQIVNQLNSNMIRVNSVRDALNRVEPASPMLIRLQPGVLKQISGKRVTVEIFAKSGGSDSAHFAVGCEFGSLTECGRKRFLAGSQPNASVFAFNMDEVTNINEDMFLTLSTDTTSEAAVTGKGDVLDIVYIRLAVEN
jgi:hypothetical protein